MVFDYTCKMTSFHVAFQNHFLPVVEGDVCLTNEWVIEWIFIRQIHLDPLLRNLLEPLHLKLKNVFEEILYVPSQGQEVEGECVICLENFTTKDSMALFCNHVFHKKCIEMWRKQCLTCPFCRNFQS